MNQHSKFILSICTLVAVISYPIIYTISSSVVSKDYFEVCYYSVLAIIFIIILIKIIIPALYLYFISINNLTDDYNNLLGEYRDLANKFKILLRENGYEIESNYKNYYEEKFDTAMNMISRQLMDNQDKDNETKGE